MNKLFNEEAGEGIQSHAELANIKERLGRIEEVLTSLRMPKREKHFYSTCEAAENLETPRDALPIVNKRFNNWAIVNWAFARTPLNQVGQNGLCFS